MFHQIETNNFVFIKNYEITPSYTPFPVYYSTITQHGSFSTQ